MEKQKYQVYYIGPELPEVVGFSSEDLKKYKLVGTFNIISGLLKTMVKGEFKPVKESEQIIKDSILNYNQYFYIEGLKLCEKLNFNSITGEAIFYFNNPRSIQYKYPYKIFIAMPFDEKYEDHFSAIIEVCNELKNTYNSIEYFRMDMHIGESVDIPHEIEKNILECGLFICDLSEINANVYYELGVADALKKKIIIIAPKGNNLPFDIRNRKAILFKNNTELKKRLRNDIKAIFEKYNEYRR